MDPDLLLAIALSQSLMEKEVSPTTLDNSQETQDTLKHLSLENVKGTDYLQVYFEQLVDAVRKDVLFEHLSLLPPLSKLLVDGPYHFTIEQLAFLGHLLKFISTCLKISDLSKYSTEGVELIKVTSRAILKFAVEAIEHMCGCPPFPIQNSAEEQTKKDYQAPNITTLKDFLMLVDLLCTIDQSLHASGATTRSEFKLPAFPRFSPDLLLAPSKEPSESTVPATATTPNTATTTPTTTTTTTKDSTQETTKEASKETDEMKVLEDALAKFMKFDEISSETGASRQPGVAMDDLLKRFEEYFEKELKGVSRLLRASANFVMPWNSITADLSVPSPNLSVATGVVIQSRAQLNDFLDRLEFTQKVLELLASTHLIPCDRYTVTDSQVAPWLIHATACLLALHRAEETFYRNLQQQKSDPEILDEDTEPCLIERSMLDDLLYISEKLSDTSVERTLQVAIVLGVLGSFDDLAAQKLEPSTLNTPAFNPDLVELALQVAKTSLSPNTLNDRKEEKDHSNWAFSKDSHGPITQVALSQGKGLPELVLNGRQWHSWENAVQYLLNGPILLDSLSYLLAVTYAQSGKAGDSAIPSQEVKKVDEPEPSLPSAMETDSSDVAPDDDNMFGGLFSESAKPTSFKEPTRSTESMYDSKFDDDALDLAKNIVDFLGGTLMALPAHLSLVRKLIKQSHVDTLIYIASNGYDAPTVVKPPLEDTSFAEGFRRLVHHAITGAYLTTELQEYLVRSTLAHTPALSRESVHMLARLFVARRAVRTIPAVDDALVLAMWESFLASLQAVNEKEKVRVGREYTELLLLSFYMLQPIGKATVLGRILSALSSLAASRVGLSSSGKKVQAALAISSLTLILNYILCNATTISADLVAALDCHIFSTSETKRKEKHVESAIVQLHTTARAHPFFSSMYSLPSLTITKPEQVVTLVSAHASYDTIYKLFYDLLDSTPTGDLIVDDHFFYTIWDLINQLPPSAQFLSAIRNPKLFQTKPTTSLLVYIQWLIKIVSKAATNIDEKTISEIPLFDHYTACTTLLTELSERMQTTQIEEEGVRTYSLAFALFQLLSFPFRSGTEVSETQAVPLAQSFAVGASAILRSVAAEYSSRVLTQVQQQQVQQQQQRLLGHQPQTPPPPPPPPSSGGSIPPPPPPPPSKHSTSSIATPQPPLEDATMDLIAALSRAGAPSSVLTSQLPYPSHTSASLFSPSSVSAVTAPQSMLVPAIPPLCPTSLGELSIQALISYIISVCAVVVQQVKTLEAKGLTNTLTDLVHDSIFGFIHGDILPLFAALVSSKSDREILLGTSLVGHIVELAVSHAKEPVAITYLVDTLHGVLSSPARIPHLSSYFLPASLSTDVPMHESGSERPRGLEVWLEVLRGVHGEVPNHEILGLMCEMALKDAKLRAGFAQGMRSMNRADLSSWLQEKLLGHKEGDTVVSPPLQEHAIRFLYILVFGDDINASLASLKMDINPPPPEPFEFEMFDILLQLLRVAFDTYFQNAKEYFVFLQVLAVHTSQLPKLMQEVISMVPELSPHFTSQPQQALSVTSVWTQFLSTILAHCKKVVVTQTQPTPMNVDRPPVVEKDDKDRKLEEKDTKKEAEDKELAAVAGKCCTYAQTGNNYTEQHWYFCYTCKLMGSNGCCSVCVRVCHRGHDVGYSRFSRFFCDCGASTTSTCKSLKPIKYKPASTESKDRNGKQATRTPHVLRMVEEATTTTAPQEGLPVAAPLSQPIVESLLGVVSKESLVDTLFPVLTKLQQIMKQDHIQKEPIIQGPVKQDLFSESKKSDTTSVDFFGLKRSVKAGAFDVKLAETRDNRKITRRALDSNSRRRIAVGEQDRVIIVQIPKLIEDIPPPPPVPSSAPAPPPPPSGSALPASSYSQIDKASVKTHAVAAVGFEVMSVLFNPSNENYLAVCGPRECRVLTLNSRDEVVDQLSVELALDGAANMVLRSEWLPGSQVKLGIIASQCVKVYDLSRDALSPLYYFTLLEDSVREAVFAHRNGATTMLLLSATGMLFAQPLGSLQDGPCIITDTLTVPPALAGINGATLYYSHELDLLLVTYADGKCVALRLNSTFTEVVGGFVVCPSSPPPPKNATATLVAPLAPHTSWVELESSRGNFVALSYSSPLARAPAPLVGLSITKDEIKLQGLKPTPVAASGKSSPRVEGLTVIGGKRQSVIVLLDDGSLHRYDPIIAAEPEVKKEVEDAVVAAPSLAKAVPIPPRAKSAPKKESAQTSTAKPASPAPVFPVDFFEKVECITPNVQFSADALSSASSSDIIHQKLASNEEHLLSTSPDLFTLTVTNPFQYTVMVGVRVLLGAASLQHISKEIRVFDRVIKTTESVRRWYDIPFTQAESISAEQSFSIAFGPTYVGAANPPIVDCVEVYGLSKEDFGWDAALAQHAAASQPAHDAQSVAKMGSAEIALYYTLSAIHHYLLLVPPPLPNMEDVKNGLPLPVAPPATGTASMLSRLPALLNDPNLPAPLRTQVKSLLLAICHNHPARYAELKDSIQLRHVADVLLGLTASQPIIPSPTTLDHCLRTLRRVSRHRPSHLAICVRLVGSGFSSALLRLTQPSLVPGGSLAPLAERPASGLVEVIFTYIVMMWEKDPKASSAAMRDLAEVLAASPQSAATALCTRISDAQQQNEAPTNADTEMQDVAVNDKAMQDLDQVIEYQCDSCHTIILDQRWHCNECADFDLCDKCYKSHKEAPPHATTHAMTNHPIRPTTQSSITLAEDDYAMQEAPEDEELEKAIALSMVESPLTPTASTSTSTVQTVPIGPPKPLSTPSTVLERLLEVVLDQFKLVRGRGGVATIPYLQVVHALTKKLSVNGLPPARLSQRIIQVLLPQQLVPRSTPTAEEDYLSLVLFWILLAKAKRAPVEPAGTTTTSTAYAQVVHMLVEDTQLMDKLYTVANDLLQLFKRNPKQADAAAAAASAAETRVAVPGALLTERANVVAPVASSTAFSASPFFSETYARSHKDLFQNFPKILSEVVMRLVLAIYSCAGKQDHPVLLSNQWEQLLCNFIQTEQTSFVHKHCKRLLLSISGSRESYYLLRDNTFLSSNLKKVRSITKDITTADMTYEQSVKLVECLQKIEETINLRPHNWILHCTGIKSSEEDKEIIPFLLGIVFYLREEAALLVLKLLVALFADDTTKTKKSSSSSSHSKKEKTRSSSEEALSAALLETLENARKEQVKILLNTNFTKLVNICLLEYNATAIRLETRNLIHKMWQYSNWEHKVAIFQILCPFVVQAPSYGANAAEFMELLTYVTLQLQQTTSQEAQDLVVKLVALITPIFHKQNQVLANHPNSYLYRTLGSLVDVEGYYLESEPCLVCNDPELHFVNARLETLKSEMKFTDKTHLVKFNATYTIASLNLHISDIKKTKMVRTINVYHTNKVVGDLGELRNKWALWKKVRTFSLSPEQTDVCINLPICVNANNLLIEYAEFYENLSVMASEKLQCPRCSRTVTDKHGICKHCHENAFQCRQCRNINYENLHAFLCNECGYCKYGKFEYTLAVKQSYATDKIESDEDHKKVQQTIEKESEVAARNAQQLAAYRRPLVRLVAMLHDRDAAPRDDKEKEKEKEKEKASKEKEKDKDSKDKDKDKDGKEKSAEESRAERDRDSNSLLSTITISASDSQTLSLARVNKRVALLALLYGKECKSVFESLSKAVQIMIAAKRELIRYMSKGRSKPQQQEAKARPANRCYGCAIACVTQTLTLATHLLANPTPAVHEALVQGGIVEGILNCTMYQGDSRVRSGARTVLCAVSKDSEATTAKVLDRIKTKIQYGLDNHLIVDLATTVYNEVLLLKEVSSVDDKFWDQRLKLVLEIFFFTLQNLSTNPVVAEHVVLPLLRILVTICVPSLAAVKDDKSKDVKKKADPEKALREAKEKLSFFGLLGKPGLSSRLSSPSQSPLRSSISSPSASVPASPHQAPTSPFATNSMFENPPALQWGETSMAYDEWASRYGNLLINPPAKSTFAAHEQRLARKYATRWQQKTKKATGAAEEMEDLEGDLLDVLISNSWLKSLLFHTSSISIRAETAVLVEELSRGSPQRRLRMLDLMTQLLESAGEVGETSTEFFSLYRKLVEPEDRKLYLTVKGFLPYICALISKEIDRIVRLENAYTTDTSQGYVLMTTISLLSSFLRVPTIRTKFKRDDQLYHSEEGQETKSKRKRNEHHLLERVLDAFLSLRGIILNKTKFIDDSVNLLQGLLKLLNSESYEDNQLFMAACIKALDNHEEGRTPIFIFEQLCNIVKPPRAEPVYMLTLNKMPSQEEFIRGNMTKNPYSSTDVGPLMRDVKNKICRTLDLRGLLDDDNGMELLVHSKIIKLDLPVSKVYEHVWRRGVAGDNDHSNIDAGPMQVVYRLQGLDGEATEEIVDKIVAPINEANQIDPEEEYKITAIMNKCGGLSAMKRFLYKINDFGGADKELATLVLRLLFYSCKLKVNRLGMIELGMMDVLLEKVKKVFGKDDNVADAAEMMLLIIESIVEQIYISEDSKMNIDQEAGKEEKVKNVVSTDEGKAQMAMFMDKLASPVVHNNPKVTKTMTRIIPFLTYGNESVMKVIVDYLAPYLNFADYDANHATNTQQTIYLEAFIAIFDSIRKDTSGQRLKSMILESGITNTLIKYLQDHFPSAKPSDQFAEAMKSASLPFVLSLLAGLSRYHSPTQRTLLTADVIPCVHTMEGMMTVAKIPTLAENLLEALRSENPEVASTVESIRGATKAEKLKQAEQHRMGVLKSLGLLQTDGGKITANVVPKSIEELEDETGFTCMVCREGYSFKPTEVLGFYTYSKRVPLAWLGACAPGSGGRSENGYTTVTHFNVIHFSCHRDATKAERGLKVPKEEWEGAALRNQQTKCNAIFPLPGPRVSEDSFQAHLDKYWAYLSNVGRVDLARFRVLVHDIKFICLRFAREESFSTDSKGGGKESNIRSVPFFITGGMAMLDQRNNPQRPTYEKTFAVFAAQTQEAWDSTQTQADNILYMLVLSLFVQGPQQWQGIRFTFLKRLLAFAGAEYRANRARELDSTPATPPTPSSPTPSSPAPSPDEVFKSCRPLLIFFTFIDRIHSILKPTNAKTLPPPPTSTTTTSTSTTSPTQPQPTSSSPDWVIQILTLARSNPIKLQNDFRDLLANFEDELLAFESFMEFADFLELLPTVMTETADCNEFLLKHIGLQNVQ